MHLKILLTGHCFDALVPRFQWCGLSTALLHVKCTIGNVDENNPSFWKAFLKPKSVIPVQPETFNMGSVLQILKTPTRWLSLILDSQTLSSRRFTKLMLPWHLVLVFTEFCNVQNLQTSPVVSPVMVIDIFPRYTVTVFTKSSNLMSAVWTQVTLLTTFFSCVKVRHSGNRIDSKFSLGAFVTIDGTSEILFDFLQTRGMVLQMRWNEIKLKMHKITSLGRWF